MLIGKSESRSSNATPDKSTIGSTVSETVDGEIDQEQMPNINVNELIEFTSKIQYYEDVKDISNTHVIGCIDYQPVRTGGLGQLGQM